MDDEEAEWVGEFVQSLTLLKLDPFHLYLVYKGEGPGSLRELMVRPDLNPGMLYCPPLSSIDLPSPSCGALSPTTEWSLPSSTGWS